MPRHAISVTLDDDNLTWLRGKAGAAGIRSVSELLNQIVTAARQSGHTGPSRSVAGTIDIDAADPLLERADAADAAAERKVSRKTRLRALAQRVRLKVRRRRGRG